MGSHTQDLVLHVHSTTEMQPLWVTATLGAQQHRSKSSQTDAPQPLRVGSVTLMPCRPPPQYSPITPVMRAEPGPRGPRPPQGFRPSQGSSHHGDQVSPRQWVPPGGSGSPPGIRVPKAAGNHAPPGMGPAGPGLGPSRHRGIPPPPRGTAPPRAAPPRPAPAPWHCGMKQDVGRTARADGPGRRAAAAAQPIGARRGGRRSQWGSDGPRAAAGGAVFERGAAAGRRALGAAQGAERAEASGSGPPPTFSSSVPRPPGVALSL